jgi:3-hydroxy-9,10-secoandrosta-1,3,5(10)-triene-9,17-dione monooxygenase reductase component
MSVADFAGAMSALASGVVIVTSRVGDRPWGTTVTAFTSVSTDPPTILVSLGAASTGVRAITATGRFGVSILEREQLDVARYAATPGAAKFLEPFTDPGRRSSSPVVAGALAHLDCELSDEVHVADHSVFFGRVRGAWDASGGTPLVYYRRAYRTLADPARAHRSIGRRIRCQSS